MYFPFLRGKQYELTAIRELAPRIANNLFKPIIEPVRNNLLPLTKTIKNINFYGFSPLIIVNPDLGDFKSERKNLLKEINALDGSLIFEPCLKINDNPDDSITRSLKNPPSLFIPEILDESADVYLDNYDYIIVPVDTPETEFTNLKKIIIIDDPFQKKTRNADYKEKSNFSSLHTNFQTKENVVGFSDYTIVGSEYSESGGPAFVVTIHLSYIDKKHNQMLVRHFSSPPSKSPANPGGKFHEALTNAIEFIEDNPDVFYETQGIEELLKLYKNEHFPGLGLLKKISIQHHIETLCIYLDK